MAAMSPYAEAARRVTLEAKKKKKQEYFSCLANELKSCSEVSRRCLVHLQDHRMCPRRPSPPHMAKKITPTP